MQFSPEEEWKHRVNGEQRYAHCRAEQAESSQNKGQVHQHPRCGGCKRPVRRRATFKDEMMAGTEETGGLAEEQELPKTRSNDWLFDWRGKKSVTKGQVRPHFFHLTV